MKVQVNHDLCEGNRRCENAAPEVFEVRDDDLSYVKLDPVPERLKEAVDRAIRLCPRQAIAWADAALSE
ncbi:MAG TPA: ferredoxin [Dehalococcoidia bacterium]|jgi:ferredoxin|nr:ferredoxin [Dehalococcoidia bacterium]